MLQFPRCRCTQLRFKCLELVFDRFKGLAQIIAARFGRLAFALVQRKFAPLLRVALGIEPDHEVEEFV